MRVLTASAKSVRALISLMFCSITINKWKPIYCKTIRRSHTAAAVSLHLLRINALNHASDGRFLRLQELNVRQLTLSADKDKYAIRLRAEPDHMVLGKRLKGAFKPVMAAIKELKSEQLEAFQKTGRYWRYDNSKPVHPQCCNHTELFESCLWSQRPFHSSWSITTKWNKKLSIYS